MKKSHEYGRAIMATRIDFSSIEMRTIKNEVDAAIEAMKSVDLTQPEFRNGELGPVFSCLNLLSNITVDLQPLEEVREALFVPLSQQKIDEDRENSILR